MTTEQSSETGWEHQARKPEVAYRLARWALAAFVVTFICARILVILIMSRKIPDLYMHVGGNHVHHLNYGIFMLCGVGAYLLFTSLRGHAISAAAAVYGVGLGLTFDEFGMWLHLGGSYWQRASFDAVVVVAALLGLVAVAPEWKKLRALHWQAAGGIALLVILFAVLLIHSVERAGHRIMPSLLKIEQSEPG